MPKHATVHTPLPSLDSVVFVDDVQRTKNGREALWLKNGPLVLVLEGVIERVFESKAGESNHTVEVSVGGDELAYLQALDDKLSNLEVRSLPKSYSPILKPPWREGAPHTIRVKLHPASAVYKQDGVDADEATRLVARTYHPELKRGTHVGMCLRASSLWTMNRSSYGMSLYLDQLVLWERVEEPPAPPPPFSFFGARIRD